MGDESEEVEGVPVELLVEDLLAEEDVADDGDDDTAASDDENTDETVFLALAETEVGDDEHGDAHDEEVRDDVDPGDGGEGFVVEESGAIGVGGGGVPVVGEGTASEKLDEDTGQEGNDRDDAGSIKSHLLLGDCADEELGIMCLVYG